MYTAKKEFFMKYDYMFDMIHVDIEKELNDVYSWEWVEFRLKYGKVANNNLVASKPVSIQQFCIYLNSILISGKLEQITNTTQFEVNKSIVIKDINKINLEFDEYFFKYDNKLKNDEIVGVESATDFCNFICQNTNNNIDLLQFNPDDIRRREDWYHIELSDSAIKLLSSTKEKHYLSSYREWAVLSSGELKFNYVYDIWDTLNSHTNYTFRLMQIKEEEQ
jgi:hypothetical protein